MNHIGFSGTRFGMSDAQRKAVKRLFQAAVPFTLHHGDCIGADSDAHAIAEGLRARIVVHPPIKDGLRAFEEGDEIREPKGYFARNRDIVLESSVVIATPYAKQETVGGTWYTINFAKEMGRSLIIVWPDGEST